ncbi:DUF4118 domain-containing protein [Methyloraptor flagellatus]|uniref:histidine kinase n=1 Tax=Methyloraptor flagellatus TaxID=3162530 RepID=A0AAU7X997_9HYPH
MAPPRDPDDRRPDPDALLALAGPGRRGRLKVFLGASPGVGKTYAMLQGARRLKADGIDVVIGLVETHGRAETAALTADLEILPRRIVDHGGRAIAEFDLDSALARRPKLIVVDELAHTNAPDSRHPKRWQDVDELLDAGIDVWTALNIQHLESLKDVVGRITGVTVRETVPDTVLQEADDVVLVDITPDELIERLRDGKVYMADTARRAIDNFFTPGNLTALRELALRRTADRVDDQMVEILRQKAIEGPWGSSERLMVLIGGGPESERLVRRTASLATALNAGFVALHAERPGADEADPGRAKATTEALRLAESLGAETARIAVRDFVEDVLRYARRENVTQIVVGRSARSTVARLLRRSPADRLIRRSREIGVTVVADEEAHVGTPLWRAGLSDPRHLGRETLVAAVAVAGAVGVGEALTHFLKLPNLSMVFLTAVLFAAARTGTRAAVIAAFLSFFAYNFFFIPPLYTFTIAEPHELLALVVFLIVAVMTGSLAGRVREQSRQAWQRAEASQALSSFTSKLSAAADVDGVAEATVAHAHRALGGRALLLLPRDGDLELQAAWPPDEGLDTAEISAARWAFEKAEVAGWRTGTLPKARFQFRPLVTPRGVVGVIGFEPPDQAAPLPADLDRSLAAIVEQAAIALDRSLLFGEAVKAAALQENEAVRDALLASLSHDLRTPLATITGAVTTLSELGEAMTPAARRELLGSIEQEAARLNRFVANLIDMSRIESGAVKIKRDWVDVADAIRTAVGRADKVYPAESTTVSLAPDLPFVRGDAQLLEQVLFNLLDNAHKYGGERGVAVHARQQGPEIVISVTDEGPGVKPADLDRIFEKFFRAGRADGRKPGTGLGLSICRGLVAAMGGTIKAESPAVRRRGTRIVVRLPAAEVPADTGVATGARA